MKYFFLMFLVVALLAAATSSFGQLPVVPPHRQIRPAQPNSPAAGPSVAPAPVGGPSAVYSAMQRIDAKASQALQKSREALRRAGRRAAAPPPPPSPITAAMGDAADSYTDQFQWSQAVLRNNGDEALARLDPAYLAYQQVRQDPAHQIADAKAYAGLIGYDHAKVMDLKYQVAALQGRVDNLEKTADAQAAAIEANDGLTRSVARETATALGVSKDGTKPSKKEKKPAAAWLAGL